MAILALKPCSLTPSQRLPNRLPVMDEPVQPGSLGNGMSAHKDATEGLIPRPLGSHAVVPFAPQLAPVARLKVVGTGGLATGSAWQAALQTLKCRMPARMSAEGTARSIVEEL